VIEPDIEMNERSRWTWLSITRTGTMQRGMAGWSTSTSMVPFAKVSVDGGLTGTFGLRLRPRAYRQVIVGVVRLSVMYRYREGGGVVCYKVDRRLLEMQD
jgi:hypothetical protein